MSVVKKPKCTLIAVETTLEHALRQYLTLERPKGWWGGGSNGPPIGFSDQNETFNTCSLITSASFDVNWMTASSLIIYA